MTVACSPLRCCGSGSGTEAPDRVGVEEAESRTRASHKAQARRPPRGQGPPAREPKQPLSAAPRQIHPRQRQRQCSAPPPLDVRLHDSSRHVCLRPRHVFARAPARTGRALPGPGARAVGGADVSGARAGAPRATGRQAQGPKPSGAGKGRPLARATTNGSGGEGVVVRPFCFASFLSAIRVPFPSTLTRRVYLCQYLGRSCLPSSAQSA